MDALVYLVTALPFLMAIVLALALSLFLLAAYYRFAFGFAVLCIVFWLDAASLSQPVLRLGAHLYVPDLPMVLLGFVALLRWLWRDDLPRRHAAWVLLALVFFAGLGTGLVRHGTTAGVQARPDFYAIAAATYTMSFPIGARQARQVAQALTALAVSLLALCIYRWIVYYGPLPDLLPPGGTYNIDGPARVVGSNSALVIAQALLLGLFFGAVRLGVAAARWLSPLLLACTLVLQHRSVWLAAIAGVLLSLLLARAQRAPLWQQLMLASAVAFTAAAPVVFNQALSDQVQSSATRALTGQGTVQARVANWRATLEQWTGEGPRSIALGRLPGSDAVRSVTTASGSTLRIAHDPHNYYVRALTSYGVLGATALAWTVVWVIGGLSRRARADGEDAPVSAALLVLLGMQWVYYIAYTVDYLQFALLGVALAWVAQGGRARAVTPDQDTHAAAGASAARRRGAAPA